MRVHIQNGVCAGRWSCANFNKDCCQALPDKEGILECENYKMLKRSKTKQ